MIGMGAMGAAIGGRLRTAGFAVCTDLTGRSQATKDRAKEQDIEVVSFKSLLSSSDMILSIVPPKDARATAQKVAKESQNTEHRNPIYVDCNAASPESKRQSAAYFHRSGIEFIDGAIIGEPPTDSFNPQFYAACLSDSALQRFLQLSVEQSNGKGLKIKILKDKDVGSASALKSSYSGITKGTLALLSAMTISAQKNGALDALLEELQASRPAELQKIKGLHRILTPRAYRFGPEMSGIGEFAKVAEADEIYEGMAKFYEHLAEGQKQNTGDWKVLEEVSRKASSTSE